MDKIASLGVSTLVLTSALAVFAAHRMEIVQPSRLPTPFPLAPETDETSVTLSDGRALTLRFGQLVLDGHRIDLGTHRRFASLTAMSTGQVLIWGGIDDSGHLVETGEWFEPSTGALVTTGRLGLPVRAGHTLNVLTDGTLVMTGGWGEGNQPAHDVALWRPLDRRLTLERGDAAHVRLQGHATLLADGSISVAGGVDDIGRPVQDAWRFEPSQGAKESGHAHGVAASYPARDRQDASPIGPLALRFDEPVDVKQLGSAVSLLGPNGVVKTRVVGAENGRLAFIQLPDELYPSARYTIFVQGLHTSKGDAVPYEAIGFTTKAARNGVVLAGEGKRPGTSDKTSNDPPQFVMAGEGKVKPCKPADAFHLCRDKGSVKDGAFYPGQDNVATPSGGHWRLYRDRQTLPDTRATEANLPKGDTALIGQVRRIDETPVANVAIEVDGQTVRTDARGVFVLSHLRSGRRELFVDGRPAGSKDVEYGRFVVGADVTAATVNHMPYVMYLPRVLERDKIALPSPTTRETVLTHPDMPGLELRIPAGAVFKDRDGKVLNEIAIVPTPVDHAPFPLPDNFPMYFTIQPGDAVVQGMTPEAAKGIQVVYPNYGKQKPADKADFWVYSAEKGWEMYGAGHVSADASQLIADNDTRLVWALGAGASTNPSEPDNGKKPDNRCGGEPIDLQTGRFFHIWHDITIADTMPLIVDRASNGVPSFSSPFGFGTGTTLAMTISTASGFDHPKLVLSCGEPIDFDLVSGQAVWPLVGTVWRHTGTKSIFYGATMQFLNDSTPEGAHWVVTLTDGSQFWFDRHAPNKLARHVDKFGNAITYSYDSGLLKQITSPNGRFVAFSYNNDNLIKTISDPIGRSVNYEYKRYSSGGTDFSVLKKVSYPDGTYESYSYATWTDSSQQIPTWIIESIVDRKGRTIVRNELDAISHSKVVKQTLADGSTLQFDYEVLNGVPTATSLTNAIGQVERSEFDPISGYVSSVTRQPGTEFQRVTKFNRASSGLLNAILDPSGRTTSFNYDARGNVTTVTRLAGTSEAVSNHMTYLDGDTQITSVTDALGYVTTFNYEDHCLSEAKDATNAKTRIECDAQGRVRTIIDPLGRRKKFDYSGGDLTSLTDALGRTIRIEHDAVGRVTSITQPDGGVSTFGYDSNDRLITKTDRLGRTSTIEYDEVGNVLKQVLPNGASLAYEYDAMNRPISLIDPDGGRETWRYDEIGRLIAHTDRRGELSTFSYDALNRPLMRTYSDGSGTQYSYDAADRPVEMLDSVSGHIAWTYDDLNRMISETSSQGTVAYTYDLAGRRTSMSVNTDSPVKYDFDESSRIIAIRKGNSLTKFAYDASGRRIEMRLPNKVEAVYEYDDADELTALKYVTPSGNVIKDINYTYNLVGQRVTSSQNSLLPDSSQLDSTFSAGNRLLSVDGSSFSYDANGNITSDGQNTYVWNARNLLASVTTEGGQQTRFFYDALGRRIGKQEEGSRTEYLFDGQRVIRESGASTRSYTEGPRIDEHLAVEQDGSVRFFIADDLHTTIALTDEYGQMSDDYVYSPYGDSEHSGTSGNTLTFTGRERDGGGLYYYRARYYSPSLRRFISEDPLGLKGHSENVFSYASGNPVQRSDPFGLDDSICGFNPSMCGMQNNAPVNTDVFVFGSTEREAYIGPAHVGAEAVGLVGFNPYDGFYSGDIAAGMGGGGGESNNVKYITGIEALTTGEITPISMLELNVGPEIPGIMGGSGGGGIYRSCDEAGFYLHFGLDAFGEHAAFGFGFGMRL